MKEVLPVNAFKNAVSAMCRHPFIVLYMALISFAVGIINYYNPAMGVILSLSGFQTDNIFSSIIHIMQFILNPAILLKILIYAPVRIVLLSIIFALVFSGYFYVVNNLVNNSGKVKGAFIRGIKRHFFKTLYMFIVSLFLILLYAFFVSVCIIPMLAISRSFYDGSYELLLPMIFTCVITVFVVFFSSMFLKIYLYLWYPASFNFPKKSFLNAKETADRYFWRTTGAFILFDMVFYIVKGSLIYLRYFLLKGNLSSDIALFALEWVFDTLFFALFITYGFSAFRKLRE